MKCLQAFIVLIFITHFAASGQNRDYRFYPNLVLAVDTSDWATYAKVENKLTPHESLTLGHRNRIGLYMEITTNHYTGSRYFAWFNSESERLPSRTYKGRPITMVLPSMSECVNGAFGNAIEPKGTIRASLIGTRIESNLNLKMEFNVADSSYALREVEKLIDHTTALSPEELDIQYGYPLTAHSADSIYKMLFDDAKSQNQQFYEKNARCVNDPNILELLKSKHSSALIDSLVAAQSVTELSFLYGDVRAENSLSNLKTVLFDRSQVQFNHKEYFLLRDSLLSGNVPLAHFRNYYKKTEQNFPFDRYSELETCGSEITLHLSRLKGFPDVGLLFKEPFLQSLTHQLFADTVFVNNISLLSEDCDYILADITKAEVQSYCLLRYEPHYNAYRVIETEIQTNEIRRNESDKFSFLYDDYIILYGRNAEMNQFIVPRKIIHKNTGKLWTILPDYPIHTMPGIIKYTDCLNRLNEIPQSDIICMNEDDLEKNTELAQLTLEPYLLSNRQKSIYIFTISNNIGYTDFNMTPRKESSLRPSEKSFTTRLMECDFNQDGNNELLQYTVSNGKLVHYVYYDLKDGNPVAVKNHTIERAIKKTAGYRNMALLSLMGSSD